MSSCGTQKSNVEEFQNDNVSVSSQNIIEPNLVYAFDYRETPTKINDIVHTVLRIKFDYKTKQAFGKAEITVKPHFYKTDSLWLDAKMFTIISVQIYSENSNKMLAFKYDNSIIKIKLDREYNKGEEYKVIIDYIANPEKITVGGSWAINDNKGLYFIDSDTENPQIWTQGETESNSAWFPTIDSPNQKMSQEFYITVKNEFKTLSNGNLVASLLNDDGTRTDYWKQDKKHAPYLAMIAVGRYEIIENYWRDLPVFVYAEQNDVEKAKAVCENTSKMIEFYSRILKYDYPWDKYSQIFVRNFVSGAMENTGATVLGSYLLNFNDEISRRENENTIAHELSHQWFGDLVTCESWANLPLNESFATYMEYAWIENQYGKLEAEKHLAEDRMSYDFESSYKNENLIRFHYKSRDDMFDTHSYQKGALILNMLRNEVGDEAFWESLNYYLKIHKFGTAEVHDLRIAFEEITGKDLNWFFNQWFLNKGIPKLDITFTYNEQTKKQEINIIQTQKNGTAPIYILPAKIAFWFGDKVEYRKIILDKSSQKFSFSFAQKPDLVIFDSDNCLLISKKTNLTKENYIVQLSQNTNYRDKTEAIKYLKIYIDENEVKNAFLKLLDNEFWEYKFLTLQILKPKKRDSIYNEYKSKVENIMKNDKNSRVKKLAQSIFEDLE